MTPARVGSRLGQDHFVAGAQADQRSCLALLDHRGDVGSASGIQASDGPVHRRSDLLVTYQVTASSPGQP